MDPGIEVVGTASDPYIARDKIVELQPDVLTLDVEMPRMDGVAFLRKLMPQFPIPVVMVSSLTQRGKQITMEALDAGAVDFVAKPTSNVAAGLNAMLMELRSKVKIASTANVSHWKGKRPIQTRSSTATTSSALAESTDKVIAIGASTGGTEAIRRVIEKFPATTAGTVIVQHMPGGFTKMFSDRLNQLCQMQVKEAEHGDRVRAGLILIAPGGRQLEVVRSGGFMRFASAAKKSQRPLPICRRNDALRSQTCWSQCCRRHADRYGTGWCQRDAGDETGGCPLHCPG